MPSTAAAAAAAPAPGGFRFRSKKSKKRAFENCDGFLDCTRHFARVSLGNLLHFAPFLWCVVHH